MDSHPLFRHTCQQALVSSRAWDGVHGPLDRNLRSKAAGNGKQLLLAPRKLASCASRPDPFAAHNFDVLAVRVPMISMEVLNLDRISSIYAM